MDKISDVFDLTKDYEIIKAPNGYITLPKKDMSNLEHICERQQIGRNCTKAVVQENCRKLTELKLSKLSNDTNENYQAELSNISNNDVFDLTKDFEIIKAPNGYITLPRKDMSNLEYICERQQIGRNCTKTVVQENCRKLTELKLSKLSNDTNENYQAELSNISNNDVIYDRNLPIYNKRDLIIKTIRENPVVIIEGATGCGKTTQVPQYILDDAYSKREFCRIVCTQPRRVATISIANRLCQERKCALGDVVGYQIGLCNESSKNMPLLFCTTAVLLRKIIYNKSLENYTHIILDEVHERDVEMDFLITVIKHLLLTNSKHVKIIVMSATMNSSEFSNYFYMCNKPAPILNIDNRCLYEVKEYYLNDLIEINTKNYKTDMKAHISKELYDIAQKLILDIINIEEKKARLNIQSANYKIQQASILVFLPSINEINEMCRMLENINQNENVLKFCPIRFHSLMLPEEQNKVFKPLSQGFCKIILSTNIAESSVTVPDVKYVIDFCLTKLLVTDSSTGISSLQLHWTSRSSCRQRSGRVGRVMNGYVYRLVSQHFYDTIMKECNTPEILRYPLENIVLKAKLLYMGTPSDILVLALSPPDLSDIHNTILRLKEIGALHTTVNGVYSIQDGDITIIGRIIAALPISTSLSRLIVFGYIFSVLEETIIIAAGLSVPFVFQYFIKNPERDANACIQKLLYAGGSGSDLFAILKVYRFWETMRHNTLWDESIENSWAKRHFINLTSFHEMYFLIKKIKDILLQFNITITNNNEQRVHWLNHEKNIILKIAIAGAFYPNYFTYSNIFHTDRELDIYHTINENDPFNTVYFKNFDANNIGELYSHNIKELFKGMLIQPKDIIVKVPRKSEKIFIQFRPQQDDNDDNHSILRVHGRVNPAVYKAVRMRISGVPTHIQVMTPYNAKQYAEENGYYTKINDKFKRIQISPTHTPDTALPTLFEKYLKGRVTYVESCGKFYFLPLREEDSLHKIEEAMNSSSILKMSKFSHVKYISQRMIVAALHFGKYHRAKIIKVHTSKRNEIYFQVMFIDSGFVESIGFGYLRKYPKQLAYLIDLPPRVVECRLASLQPSTINSINGKWSNESKNFLLNYVTAKTIEIEIFSLEYGVANVIIHVENTTLNKLLVKNSIAREANESCLSKLDHYYRSRQQVSFNGVLDQAQIDENDHYIASMLPNVDDKIKPPPKHRCTNTLTLHGPYSPLETSVHSCLRGGLLNTVQIHQPSVNRVLLDSDPQDMHNRLLVASNIREVVPNSVIIDNTTLMPNIRGIGALITMLFCRTLQVKRDKNHTKYIGILAGLGYDKQTNEPTFGNHDVCLTLDVELDYEDFRLVNHLRYLMDNMLEMIASHENQTNITETQIANCCVKMKQNLIKYFSKNRKYIEQHDNIKFQWETENPKEIYETIDILGKRAIFPMLKPLLIQNEKEDRLQQLRLHCADLHQLKNFGNVNGIRCYLCQQYIKSIVILRIHLQSQRHRELEEKIGFDADV